ncbi:MAG: hypothetical protein AB1730_00485 [Myxococcota bacterium]|jgi:hypothetical protein
MKRAARKLGLALALFAAPAAHAVDFGLQVGALEVVLLPPAHGGVYPYLGGFVAAPLGDGFSFVGSVSFEWSFDQGRGGLVVVTTLDWAPNERVGFDLNVALIQDMPGVRFAESLFLLGAGPGVTVFLGKWAVSPFVNFFGTLNGAGASIVPGVNVGRTF